MLIYIIHTGPSTVTYTTTSQMPTAPYGYGQPVPGQPGYGAPPGYAPQQPAYGSQPPPEYPPQHPPPKM